MDSMPLEGIENDGKLMSIFDQYEDIQGVKFTAYDITDDFYVVLNGKLKGNETPEQYKVIVKEVMQKFTLAQAPNRAEKDVQTTGADGEANFTLPDRDSKGIYRVYYFAEDLSTAPADAKEFAQPVILMLPFVHPDEGELHDVHLYPKNEVENKVTKELLKDDGTSVPEGEEKPYDYEVGKEIKYKATFKVPFQIGEKIMVNGKERTRYSRMIFKDEVSATGIKFKGIEKIKAINKDGVEQSVELAKFLSFAEGNGTFVNKDSYDKTKKAGFELKMKLNDKLSPTNDFKLSEGTVNYLKNYAGYTLEFYYSVLFTEDTPIDVDINNDFKVNMINNTKEENQFLDNEDKPNVITGGMKFFKHEDGKDDQGLGGAKFIVIRKSDGKYLTKGSNNQRDWGTTSGGKYPGAHEFVSGDDGRFKVTGLEFDEYQLIEIEAPKGFQKRTDPIDFEITKGSYDQDETAFGELISNVSQGGFLPSTGGAGIAAFLVIGLSLMGVAIVRYRKTQHAA
jgi:LPXTG-motif cell wall-anchored protein